MVGKIIGKYRIVDRLGSGGMGTVYKAVDDTLDRPVAIKILHPGLADAELVGRFRAEAVTLAKLNHPGIATVYELTRESDQYLLVMEYLAGETFEQILARRGPQSLESAVVLCLHVLEALKHAHRAGVIHRDLKPANLLLTESGRVKIMDFGIARISGSVHMTVEGYMMGTPAYMAPEQIRGEEVDQRTDLYALGVVLYRLLTGRLPIVADTPVAMVQKQIGDPPTPVRQVRAELPLWIEQILERALAKSRNDRFQSAEELSEVLMRELGRHRSEAAAALPPELAETIAPPVGPYPSGGDWRLPKPSPTPVGTPAAGAAVPPASVPARSPANGQTGAGGDYELDLELHHNPTPVVAVPVPVTSARRWRMTPLALGALPALLVALLIGYRSRLYGPHDAAVDRGTSAPEELRVGPRPSETRVAEPVVPPSPASASSAPAQPGEVSPAPTMSESAAAAPPVPPGSSQQAGRKESLEVTAPPRVVRPEGASSRPARAVEPEPEMGARPQSGPPAPAPSARLQFAFASDPFSLTVYANGQAVGTIDSAGYTVRVPGRRRIRVRVVSEAVFLDHDFGDMTLQPDDEQTLTLPPLVSAFIGVAGERYAGLRIVLDGQTVPGPYPAQLARIAAGSHRISFEWAEGSLQGVEVSGTIELTGGRHFAIRAVPENDVVMAQRLR